MIYEKNQVIIKNYLEYLGSSGGCQSVCNSLHTRSTDNMIYEKNQVIIKNYLESGLCCFFENFSNAFFSAIIELKCDDQHFPHWNRGLRQVYSLLLQKEELHQGVEQFLEYCLASDSSHAEKHEFISEIVAANNIAREKATAKKLALFKRLDKFKVVLDKANDAKKRLDSSVAQTWECIQPSGEVEAKQLRNTIHLMRLWLSCDVKFHKELKKLVSEFWIYFPSKGQDIIENYVYCLLERKAARRNGEDNELQVLDVIKKFEVLLSSLSKKSASNQRKDISFSCLFSRRETEIDQLINLVLQYVDQNHSKDDWYDPLLMEKALDSLMAEVGDDTSKLVAYTKEMDDELEALLDGVEVD